MRTIITRAGVGAIATALSIFGCAAPDANEANEDTREDIIGGAVDTGHLATVLILFANSGSTSVCTGTLVAPQLVLTAAHCVKPPPTSKDVYSNWRIYFGTDATQDPNLNAKLIPVAKAIAHPQYVGDQAEFGKGHDVAALVLQGAVQGVTPMPINRQPLDASFVGKAVTAVGFGKSDGVANTGLGVKRSVTTSLTGLNAHELKVGVKGKTTCGGDSGGPIFMNMNGKETIVGVVNYGPAQCDGTEASTRIDTVLDFLDPLLKAAGAGTAPPPATGGTGNTPAPAGCTGPVEAEPNDTTPNALGASVCGTIAGNDVDKFTFTASQVRLSFKATGNAYLVLRAGGISSVISSGGTSTIQTSNTTFTLEVHGGTGNQTYQITRQ